MTRLDARLFKTLASRYGYESAHGKTPVWVFPRGDMRVLACREGFVQLQYRIDCGAWSEVSNLRLAIEAVTGLGETQKDLPLPFTRGPRFRLEFKASPDWDELGRLSESFQLTWFWRSEWHTLFCNDPDAVDCAEFAAIGLVPASEFVFDLLTEYRARKDVGRVLNVLEGLRSGTLAAY